MKRLCLLAVLAGCSAIDGATESTPVGERCYIGAESEHSSEAIIAAPALECPTRACLHLPPDDGEVGLESRADLCTAPCDRDEQCAAVEGTPCTGGFVCATPMTEGPFACRRHCVCADYLSPGDARLEVPEQCVP